MFVLHRYFLLCDNVVPLPGLPLFGFLFRPFFPFWPISLISSHIHSQTASITPSLIPVFCGQPFAFKKVNSAISLSDANREVGQLYQEISKRYPMLQLSQSDHESIKRYCQLAAIEIKSPDGSYYGATIQLAIWLAAGLEKMRQLRELAITGVPDLVSASTSGDVAAGSDGRGYTFAPGGVPADQSSDSAYPLLPYVGIAVVGHAWYLHLAVKAADGTVVSSESFFFSNSIGLLTLGMLMCR